MLTQANAIADQIVAWRREFHAHPDCGFQEQRASTRTRRRGARLPGLAGAPRRRAHRRGR